MDANVRFSYRKDSGDSKRAKLVKRLTYDRGSDSFGCSDHSGSNVREIVKKALVALLELENKLPTYSIQSLCPPNKITQAGSIHELQLSAIYLAKLVTYEVSAEQ